MPVHHPVADRRHPVDRKPVNAEPGKCSEIGCHDMNSLPLDIVSYISTGLQACARNDTFSLDNC